MELSIVTTLFQSAPYLKEFYTRIRKEAENLAQDYEVIFVNDGSPDASLEVALSIYEQDERVRVIDLSRNFGHHKAIMTGLAHARGRLVFLVDCDLEEAPELLGRFHAEMQRFNADVVYGVQEKRKGGFLEQMTGDFFYACFNLVSTYPIPANQTTARLMTRQYVASLVQHRDREVCLIGLWAITGFSQVPMVVQKRSKGSTTYTIVRRVANLVNAVTSFSNTPLIAIFYLGCGIVFTAGLAALYLVVRRLFFGVLLAGWPSLIVSIWLLGGLTIFCLGVIGIYLSKVFMETKLRPYTIIRRIYERAGNSRHELH